MPAQLNASHSEPLAVRWLRFGLRHWPFPRGRGILVRLFDWRLRRRDFLIEVEDGVFIAPKLDDYMVQWCFVGDHEKDDSFQLSLSLIGAGDLVVDAGANIGLWSIPAARRVGPTGEVHAFEPVPANMQRLTQHLCLNAIARVRCQQRALGDRNGETTFSVPSNGNSGAGGLASREGVKTAIHTAIVTLDTYCADEGIDRIDLLKVDVEGGETLVFRGATKMLASPMAPIIFFETGDRVSGLYGSSAKQVKELLHARGYGIYRLEGDHLRRVSVDEPHVHEDLFALKPAHFDLHRQLRQLQR